MSRSWRTHPNADGPAGMLLAIHDHFRAAARHLIALDDAAAIRRIFVPLAATLHHHHHAEEQMLFPAVHRRTGSAPAQLQDDHDEMTRAIEAVEAALVGGDVAPAVARFCEILVTHLDREEALVVPFLLELTPHETWALLHG